MLTTLVFLLATYMGLPAAPATGPATFITPAELEAALKEMPPTATTYDKPIKTVDAGGYKVTVVILRRIPVAGAADRGLSHDRVTEVYQIITGSGMFESGGTMAATEPTDLTTEAAGPSVRGTIQNGETRRIGPGDIIVIPDGVPHRFSKLDGMITYTVTRIEVPGTGK